MARLPRRKAGSDSEAGLPVMGRSLQPVYCINYIHFDKLSPRRAGSLPGAEVCTGRDHFMPMLSIWMWNLFFRPSIVSRVRRSGS